MLLPALADAGLDIRMCAPITPGDHAFLDELEAKGMQTRTARAGPHLNPLLFRWLHSEIRAFRPDIVHTHGIHGDVHGQPSARAARVASVSTVHGTPGYAVKGPYKLAGMLAGSLTPITVAISDDLRRFLESSGHRRPGSVRVVPYGIDADRWGASEETRSRLRASLNLQEGEVAITISARLVPGKGHALLLDALAEALRRTPGLRLFIAGEGPLRPELERRAQGLPPGAVQFMGFLDDVRHLFQASDIVATPTLPQLGEGFGLAALEAMAAGVPVVATEVGALPEVIAHGQTGILVSPEDSSALASAIVQLASHPDQRRAMGREARRHALRFSIESMVERTLAVYREAIALHASR